MKKVVVGVILVTLILAGIGGWYWFYGPCGWVPVRKTIEQVSEIMQKWTDAEQIASSTPRMSLGGQIENLQSIRREADTLEVPSCMIDVKKELVLAQQASIDGYVAFLAQKGENYVSSFFEDGIEHLKKMNASLTLVQACAPTCR